MSEDQPKKGRRPLSKSGQSLLKVGSLLSPSRALPFSFSPPPISDHDQERKELKQMKVADRTKRTAAASSSWSWSWIGVGIEVGIWQGCRLDEVASDGDR